MNRVDYKISSIMGYDLAACQRSGMSIREIVERTDKRQMQSDSVSISGEAARQHNEIRSFRKEWEDLMAGIAKAESAEQFRIDPFKQRLCAPSIFGGENLFQNYADCQYQVFGKWLEENAGDLSKESRSKILDGVKNATSVMDRLNDMEGYRGTSFESVALLESSRCALEYVKNTVVPENLRAGFEQLIGEYTQFNEMSRNQIMEKMTPAYMVRDIGKNTQHKVYKDELLSKQQSFYSQEKEQVRDLLREYYSDTSSSNKAKVEAKLQRYTEQYYKKNNPMYADHSLFAGGLACLMIV